jgi:hypothetical protein
LLDGVKLIVADVELGYVTLVISGASNEFEHLPAVVLVAIKVAKYALTDAVLLAPVVEQKYGANKGEDQMTPNGSLMVLKLAGILIVRRERIPRNVIQPKVVNVEGRINEVTEFQSTNAP